MKQTLDQVDRAIASFMRRWGVSLVRFSFAIIFIWFGLLKPLGLSTTAPLVKSTVAGMPFLSADQWVEGIGWWEVLIGIPFLFHDARNAVLSDCNLL